MLFRDIVAGVVSGQAERSTLAFYIKRIGQEQAVRTLSLIVVLAVVILQTVTWLAPPKVSQASSGSANDIIYGGFSSKADLLNKYNSNNELRSVYLRFGIGYDQINGATVGSVNSSADVWSAGRVIHGPANQNIVLDTPGAATLIYIRPLKVWGSGIPFSALTGIAADGRRFWILFDCGNPVIEALKTENPAAKVTPAPATPVPSTPRPAATPPPVVTPLPPGPLVTPKPTVTSTPKPATPTPVLTPIPQALYVCEQLKAYYEATNTDHNVPLKVTFEVDAKYENTTLQSYEFDFGDGSRSTISKDQVQHTYTKVGQWVATVRVRTTAGTTAISPACSQTIKTTSQELTYLKTAENLTVKDSAGKPVNAAGTTANPGDEIRYSLSVKNNGIADLADFQFREDIGDILEYADVKDFGGSVRSDAPLVNQPQSIQKNLVWTKVTIPAGKTITKNFTVKLKARGLKPDVYAQARGVTDSSSYDLTLENHFYGNTVNIHVPANPVKQVELTSQALPATGPGAANLALGLFAAGAVFITLRQRLIAKELALLVTTGGKG